MQTLGCQAHIRLLATTPADTANVIQMYIYKLNSLLVQHYRILQSLTCSFVIPVKEQSRCLAGQCMLKGQILANSLTSSRGKKTLILMQQLSILLMGQACASCFNCRLSLGELKPQTSRFRNRTEIFANHNGSGAHSSTVNLSWSSLGHTIKNILHLLLQ